MLNSQVNEEIDQEWLDLILEALDMGVSPEEIRNFFKKPQIILGNDIRKEDGLRNDNNLLHLQNT